LAEKLEVEKARKEAKTNARIDEIMGELKAERNERIKDQERMRALESELNALKNPTTEDAIERKEAERIAKYTAEDKKLPREKRREMDNSELEEWLMEDIVAAQRWLANQTLRRDRERQADLTPKDDAKAKADAVIRKQEQSKARVALKHPELDVTKRVAELREQGKTQADIQATIFKENPKARIVAEIMQENPDKYILHENGPELLAEEMERRLKTAPKKQVNQEDLDAEVEARVQAELRRRESLPENIRSNRDGGPEKKLNDLEKVQWVTFKKMFPQKTFADFESMQKRREKVA
jgi:hypothetical protein